MGRFIIEGGHKLSGEITPQGAKNEALEVISAVLLTADPVVISNVPEILDVKNLIGLLQGMGVKVQRLEKGTYRFQADEVDTAYIETEEFVSFEPALKEYRIPKFRRTNQNMTIDLRPICNKGDRLQ